MKKDLEVTEKKTSSNRRNLLKALTAGGAAAAVVPAEWAKPLVKATILPAHAQATVSNDCSISYSGFWVSLGASQSYSMEVNASAPADCGSIATMTVYDSTGSVLGGCTTQAYGGAVNSWSCSASGSTTSASVGDDVTFVVSFDNGCSCSIIQEVEAEIQN